MAGYCTLDLANFPVQRLVVIVANLLDAIITTNDKLTMERVTTHFDSRAVPSITVSAYLTRILKYAPFSNEVLLSLLVYFDRIANRHQHAFILDSFNIHRLLISSIVIASKFWSDVFYSNSRYAKVGGLSVHEMNKLEIEFLFLCNFDLHVRLEDLQTYGNELLAHATYQQSLVERCIVLKKRKSPEEDHGYFHQIISVSKKAWLHDILSPGNTAH
ncbi:cyclin-domain-containing protein [Radiomyces spectabilis]|uniref:cyclin-domain-containing protein n=1 Tax=Radiomyces spectabilis TaxID=64574 RepID=UPI002220D582|nr:cyclin-domain-containing protein [Radiomyces spectabilis]KAI8381407.1 cyclin-domain-containing protein [Radiomyces spectabilis]